jgi:3-oxoadipate enol-lactonase
MPSLEIDDVKIHYQDRGQGPALLLLHGLGSSGMDWEHQYPHFEPDYRVVAPDFRGFGESDKPAGPYLVSRHADDLVALLDHLEIREVNLLGFSMGGAVAFQFAASYPERVERLVIVNSSPSFVTDHWRKRLEVVVRKSVIRLLGVPQLARLIAKRLFPEEHQGDLRAKTIERYGANHKDAYLNAIDGLVGWHLDDATLRDLQVPTLVIAAEHDYTPFSEKEAYCAKLPQAQLVLVENSRHATPIDQPDCFNRLVAEFLGDSG